MNKLKQSIKIYVVLLPLVYFLPREIDSILNLKGFPGFAITNAIIVLLMVFIALPSLDKTLEKLKINF